MTLRQLWHRLHCQKQNTEPTVPVPAPAYRDVDRDQARERLLRDILRYAQVALAYSEPCQECQRRAARAQQWKAELTAELEAAISAEKLMSQRRAQKALLGKEEMECHQQEKF